MENSQGSDELIEIIELHDDDEDEVQSDEDNLNTSGKNTISWNDIDSTLITPETKSTVIVDVGACVENGSLKPVISSTTKDLFRRNSSGYSSRNSSSSSKSSPASRCNILKRKLSQANNSIQQNKDRTFSLLKTNIQRNLLMLENITQDTEHNKEYEKREKLDENDEMICSFEMKRKKREEIGEITETTVQTRRSDTIEKVNIMKVELQNDSADVKQNGKISPEENLLRKCLEEPKEIFLSAVSDKEEHMGNPTVLRDRYVQQNEGRNLKQPLKVELEDQKTEKKLENNSSVFNRPACSYSCLIVLALKNGRHDFLHVNEIYDFICEHFPYFRNAPLGWKNSIRHNLSLSNYFRKIEDESLARLKKKFLWGFNPLKYDKINTELNKRFKGNRRSIEATMTYPQFFDALLKGEVKHGGRSEYSNDLDYSFKNTPEETIVNRSSRDSRGSRSSVKYTGIEEDNSIGHTGGETSCSFEESSTNFNSVEIEPSFGEDEITNIYKQIAKELDDEEREYSIQFANSQVSVEDRNFNFCLETDSDEMEENDLIPLRSSNKIDNLDKYFLSSNPFTSRTLRTYGRNRSS